ncbi:Uncharacterised protein [Achromobacter xylosoxidans]|nr:Uncharacterised protein [Achromobacter xylosoxidans]
MRELAQAAFAFDDGVPVPPMREHGTLPVQGIDQRQHRRLVQMRARVGPELSHHAPRALLPVHHQFARRRIEKDVAQQVRLRIPGRPIVEQLAQRFITGQHVPGPVQHVGRRGDGVHALAQRPGRPHRIVARMLRVGTVGQVEQIGPLGPRQLQHPRDARPDRRRYRHLAPLLDPGVPGDADAAQLRHLFAPQPGRAAPHAFGQAGHLRRDARAGAAHELAQRLAAQAGAFMAGGAGLGGSVHTRIREGLVRV